MPDDTYRLATGSRERVQQLTPTRKYRVPFVIEGAIEIEATDAETANFLADHKPASAFIESGELQTFDAEPVEMNQ